MNYYKTPTVDVSRLVPDYLENLDWQVQANANIQYSFPGLMDYISEEVLKRYSITTLIPREAAEAHDDGFLYIHDLGKHIVGYCAGWDLRQLLREGLSGIPDRCTTGKAKHLQTALDHAYRYIQIVCNEWAGAQAFSSLDTFMAPFIAKDKLTYKQVKNAIESFIFNLNVSTRYGGQIPFSNITLDWTVPDDLKKEPAIIGGELSSHTYGEFQKEMDIFNKALIEVFMAGDYSGQPFSFPIPTYNITKDFDWDTENADLLFEMTAKYGNPYFQNFVNSDLNPGDVRSMCCRLQMDMTKLIKKTGGRWASGASTGSIGVVDLNLPRLAYLSNNDEKKFFKQISHYMQLSKDVLEDKRKLNTDLMMKGLTPYTRRYLGNLDHHFSTISLIGMNEALLNLGKKDITTKEGIKFATKTLDHMLKELVKIQEETDHIYNLEAAPNESACYTLALKDKTQYPDIITSGDKEPFYTNSSQLPVNYTDDIFEALDLQDGLQCKYTGGTVFHVFLGEQLNTGKECKELVRKIAHNYRLPYFSITPTFSVCPEHGYIKGEAKSCPGITSKGKKCTQTPLVYSRIVGYYRPVKQWNKGKFEEYQQRTEFKPPADSCGCD